MRESHDSSNRRRSVFYFYFAVADPPAEVMSNLVEFLKGAHRSFQFLLFFFFSTFDEGFRIFKIFVTDAFF